MSLQLNIATYSNERTVLVDGDIVAFRAAAIGGDSFPNCRMAASGLMNKIVEGCDSEDIKIYFTGSENFRYLVYPIYKANRTGNKPVHYAATVAYLKNSYEWDCHDLLEADDEISIVAYELGLDNVIIASIDKDFHIVPTQHYNFIANKMLHFNEFESTYKLCMQTLTGDSTDNICGIRGIGPKRGAKLLNGCETIQELWMAIADVYELHHGDGWLEALECNLKLLNIGGGFGRYREVSKVQSNRRDFYSY